ncbi:MAG: hypothetical protein ACAI44_30525 [Candidatus Sericytochromatia bacterium]
MKPTALDVLSPMTEMQVVLHEAGYSTYLSGPEEDEPTEFLMVDLEEEAGFRPWVARLLWVEDLEQALQAKAGNPPDESPPKVWHLECLLHLPLDFTDDKIPELRLLGLWLSAQLPMGVYSVDSKQGVCFRHVLLCESQRGQVLLTIDMLERSTAGPRAHLPLFSALASGRQTLDQIRAKLSGGPK